MLKSSTTPRATALFCPGKKMECFGAAPLTARERAIAKSRGELLGLLHGLPEAEFELSLTDLVESSSSSSSSSTRTTTAHLNTKLEEEEEEIVRRNVNQLQQERHRDKKARESSSSFQRSSSSSGGGVLLNMYFPTSLTRSLTSSSGSRSKPRPKDAAEFTKRDTEVPILFSCWSAIWYRKNGKSRRRKAA